MRRRRFRSQRKSMYISLVILFFVFMSVGYSYLSRTLNIAGNIAVSKTTWDVHFENATKIDGNIDLTSVFSYTYNDTTLSLGLALNEPGQYFEFEVDVVNNGTINAMLGSIIQDEDGVLSLNGRSNYLEYSVTYDDGIPLTVKDQLPKKKRDKLKVRIAFKENVVEGNLPSNDDNFTVKFKTTYVQDDGTSHERGVAGAKMLIKKANASNTTYSGVGTEKQKEMFAFEHTSPVAKTDYRYIGSAPNNYIDFNCTESTCETWRIIGVFDGKIKIIRDLGIDSTEVNNPTDMSWDYKKYGGSNTTLLGTSQTDKGSNDWSDAQLMYLLNKPDVDRVIKAKADYRRDGNLIKDGNGFVIYELGKRPSEQAYGLSKYTGTTATSWEGLTTIAQNQVATATWNLGDLTWINDTTRWGTTEKMYQAERGTTTCYTTGKCAVERPTTWKGKVALMYPSDYGYTFGKGVNAGCYGYPGKCYSSSVVSGADPTTSWLYIPNKTQWLLSPYAGTSNRVLCAGSSGNVTHGSATDSSGVRPVVYLRSDIRLQGSGSSEDHYKIVE